MDARRLAFLDGHVDPAVERFDIAGTRAITNGVLVAPSARCTYIASIECDETLEIRDTALCKLELDMHVAELDGFDLRFDKLDRAKGELFDYWIDPAITRPWTAVAANTAARAQLELAHGNCVLSAEIAADDKRRMKRIVDVVTALAAAPVRRATELADALAAMRPRTPARLRIDGDPVVVRAHGLDIEVGTRRARGLECDTRAIRTVVRARAPVAAPLVVIDKGLERSRWPQQHGQIVEAYGWLADAWIPDRVLALLPVAAPSTLVATADEVVVVFPGHVPVAARLGAAVELVAALVVEPDTSPYR